MKLFLPVFFFLAIYMPSKCYSQNEADSTVVKELIAKGKELLNNGEFKNALIEFESAKIVAKNGIADKGMFEAESYIIEILWRQFKLDDSYSVASKLLPKVIEKLGIGSQEEGRIYHHLGTICLYKTEYDSSIYYYKKSISIIKNSLSNDKLGALSGTYSNMGYIYGQIGDINKELDYYKKAHTIDKEVFGDEHLNVAYDLNNIGTVYAKKSMREQALNNFYQALKIVNEKEIKSEFYSDILTNIGYEFISRGQYQSAFEFRYRALKNNIEIFGEDHITNSFYYIDLGHTLEYQELYDSSMYYFNQANKYFKELTKYNSAKAIYLLRGLANAELGLGNNEKSLEYLNKAFRLVNETKTDSEELKYLTIDLGRYYLKLEEFNKSKIYFTESLNLYVKSYGENHNILAYPLRKISEIYFRTHDYDSALFYIQKSILVNLNDFSLENHALTEKYFEKIKDKFELLSTMDLLFKILEKKYEIGEKHEDLLKILSFQDNMSNLIYFIRQRFDNYQDKENFNQITNHVYQNGIKYNYKAYIQTGDKEYLKRCFYFSQRSKSGALKDALTNIDAVKWSGLPENVISVEKEKRATLNYYKSLLIDANVKKNNDIDTSKVNLYEANIFDTSRDLDSLISRLEIDFPLYYQIRYKDDFTSLDRIQDKLSDNEIVVEYFLGDSTSYCLTITKNNYDVKELVERKIISKKISCFREQMEQFRFDISKPSDSLLIVSHQLYNLLFDSITENLLNTKLEKLIIIPDAELGYLPFEILLTEPANQLRKNYSNNPYLLKKYDVSYGYSAGLLFSEKEKSEATTFVSYAPSYELTTNNLVTTRSLGKFRDAFVDLEWNEEEASSIGKYFENQAKLGEAATERNFKKNAGNARILHLAMHAFVDDDEPMNSKLVFYQDNDSIEDGFLHTFELYNMRLKAEMAVLSACETGYGKLVNGEGIVSLARGFAYAGVPSVVMSHWQVDDESTSTLMGYFYDFLSKGQTKSESLRNAKLKYLENAKPAKSHPFYWAAFVLIGENSPIVEEKFGIIYIVVIVFILSLLSLIYFKRASIFSKKSSTK